MKKKIFIIFLISLSLMGILWVFNYGNIFHKNPAIKNTISSITAKIPEHIAIATTPENETNIINSEIPLQLPDQQIITQETETKAPVKKSGNGCDLRPENTLYHRSWLSPVSPSYGLGSYIPTDLVKIPDSVLNTKNICIRNKVLPDLKKMVTTMKESGLAPMIVSGYRSNGQQENLQDDNEDITVGTVVARSVALPEHSEHQLGTTIDIVAAPNYAIKEFEKSPEYAWLSEHAAEYGFTQSYPYGSESITGYRGEPWHWRYVGTDHAQHIQQEKNLLITYLQSLPKTTDDEQSQTPSMTVTQIPGQPTWYPENLHITIDDGPHIKDGVLQNIVSVLDSYGVKATFFWVGNVAESAYTLDPVYTKKFLNSVINNGHRIGYHSYDHPFINKPGYPLLLSKRTIPEIEQDIDLWESTMKNIIGPDFSITLGRMPGGYGTFQTNVKNAFRDRSLEPPLWWHEETATFEQGVTTNTEEYIKSIRSKKGDYIILLHEKERTANDLNIFLGELKRQGTL